MSKVLFEITEELLETGLRGYPVGYCTTSTVDPQKGLFYVGRAVSDLAHLSPEEVMFFLYFGKEGSPKEIRGFFEDLFSRGKVPEEVIRSIEAFPKAGTSMKLFSSALLALAAASPTKGYQEDSLNLIAKLPHLVATIINHHAGWGKTSYPSSHQGYIENFVYMLKAPIKERSLLVQAFRLFHILHLDHGGGNLSTFVGKAIASGLEDLYGSISGALLALAGPRHGRANQDCLEFVEKMIQSLGSSLSENSVETYLRGALDRKEVIPGFGHAVLRVEDPRATVFYDYLKGSFSKEPLVQGSLLLRSVGSRVLKENPKIADPYPNVDSASGIALSVSGFPYPQYFTVLFGFSRCFGIARQILYERVEARGGKGTPIVRPKYLYKK